MQVTHVLIWEENSVSGLTVGVDLKITFEFLTLWRPYQGKFVEESIAVKIPYLCLIVWTLLREYSLLKLFLSVLLEWLSAVSKICFAVHMCYVYLLHLLWFPTYFLKKRMMKWWAAIFNLFKECNGEDFRSLWLNS